MENLVPIISTLIDHQEVCFLSFVNAQGFPTTRTMLNPRKRQGIKEFYLTTNTKSQKVQALLQNPRAGLYFYDRALYRGAAFTGAVTVLDDQSIKNEIWRDMDTIFYESNTDPDYCILKFTAEAVRYYQGYRSTDLTL